MQRIAARNRPAEAGPSDGWSRVVPAPSLGRRHESGVRARNALLLCLTVLLVAQSCANQGHTVRVSEGDSYDYNTLRLSDREEIFSKGYGSYLLHCEGAFVDQEGVAYKFHLRGLVSPIDVDGKAYLLAAGHVFDLASEVSKRGASLSEGKLAPPVYYIEVDGRRVGLRRIDPGTRDLALFVEPDGPPTIPRSRYGHGDSNDLRPGNVVLSWGMPLLEGFELSVGIVSALSAPTSLLQASFPEAEEEDFFVTSMPTIFGCSGALVYAFRDGTPEIVGMVVAGYLNINRSIVYKINSILRDSGLDW